MKNIIKLCLLLGFVAYYSCDDPYKDTVYQVYDVQPAGSYLQNRSNDLFRMDKDTEIWRLV